MARTKVVKHPAKDVSTNVKNGSIHKKKHQKFKQTPQGKVALINGSQVRNGNSKPQKNGGSVQRSPSQKKSPKGGNKHSNTSGASSSGTKSPKAALVKTEKESDTEDDDEEDINEGISIKEEVSAPEDEVDDSDASDASDASGDNSSVKAILGTSLADETDDDDDEFDADSAAEESVENKGVKMFKGLKQEVKEEKSSDDDDEEDEDEDDENESEEEEEEDSKAGPGLAALLGASIADESDDEEFEAAEDDSDDDEDVSEDDEEDAEVDQSANSSVLESSNVEDDEDDDEDDDDEDEDDDSDDSSPDITALLGKSIADESDDEDFEGEEESEEDDDEDMSEDDEDVDALSSPRTKLKVKKTEKSDDDGEDDLNESHDSTEHVVTDDKETRRLMTRTEKAERNKRTIYVGNVPKETNTSTLKKIFKKFGAIDSVRIRGIVPENPKMPLKVAAITKNFHPKINNVCCFVTYKDEDSATKALEMNGKKLDGNYLRVDRADKQKQTDKKKSVFLGNLPFTVEDNEIWELFKSCGKIDSVRIIRDRKTGLGRGFGYINFVSTDGAVLALDLDGSTIQNRELRIKVNNPEATKKKREAKQTLKRSRSGTAEEASPKKMRTDDSEAVEVATHNSVNAERRTGKKKRSQGEKQRVRSESKSPSGQGNGKYQGQKADAKKKPKQNKNAKKKKQMAAKLLAKPKKPAAN